MYTVCSLVFFFVKQKTAYELRISDWSSDVCFSDLLEVRDHRLVRIALALVDERAEVRRARQHPVEDRPRVGQRLGPVIVVHEALAAMRELGEIGRAACRERGCQYV